MTASDTLRRFLFEHEPIRGEVVQLDTTFRSVRDHHDYPPAVRSLLGQTLAASALLSGSIKAHDSLIVQAQGTGPVHLLVAHCTSRRSLRGLARWSGTAEGEDLASLCGEGRLAITIDPGQGRERYQGLVSLRGPTLAAAIERYFDQSEQLPTRLWLACDGDRAAGMLLQCVPGEPRDPDAWNRVQRLADTVTQRELQDLALEDLCRRLFPEDDVRVFEGERTTFRCSCSRATITAVLRSIGRPAVEEALTEAGEVEVTCEFCNRRYTFDRVDIELALSGERRAPGPATRQ
jgi:molecular chaperone Hsp33